MAQHLVQQGIPAVIAMQFEITDAAAITLAQEFYAALADNYGVDAALAEARKALFAAGNDIEWGTPVLYLRARNGQLFNITQELPLQDAQTPSTKLILEEATSAEQSAKANKTNGDKIAASIGADAQHVVVGKNIIQIGALKIPYPFAFISGIGVILVALNFVWLAFHGVSVTINNTPTSTQTATVTGSTTTPIPPTLTAVPIVVITRTIAVDGVDIVFVYVPAGEFTMGSAEGTGYNEEHPQSKVMEPAFWIGQSEVTNAQYRPFVENGGYQQDQWWTKAGLAWRNADKRTKPGCWDIEMWNQVNYPVVCVSWYEAYAYAKWLAQKTGIKARLPTEAEWEKAARGTDGFIYPWGNREPNDQLLNYDDTVGHTTAVNSYPAGKSPYGAFDMAGNVWEWTNSQYMQYPYRNDDGRENGEGEARRIARGGCWFLDQRSARVTSRYRDRPIDNMNQLGLRLVMDVPNK